VSKESPHALGDRLKASARCHENDGEQTRGELNNSPVARAFGPSRLREDVARLPRGFSRRRFHLLGGGRDNRSVLDSMDRPCISAIESVEFVENCFIVAESCDKGLCDSVVCMVDFGRIRCDRKLEQRES
jgi:hypothetical protein